MMLRASTARFRQLLDLVFAADFEDGGGCLGRAVRRYEQPAELAHYERRAAEGLDEYERRGLRHALARVPGARTCLVLGGGAGREAFALAELGLEVTSTDLSRLMTEAGRKAAAERNIAIDFIYGAFPLGMPPGGFDLVFLTHTILNHIPSSANRVSYLREVTAFLRPCGAFLTWADVFALPRFSRYHAASVIFRARARLGLGTWEPGDTVRAYLGQQTGVRLPMFYHYYSDHSEIAAELAAAGLQRIERHDDAFVASR